MLNKIQILDDNTINKIAAGEVIERPSSVVKELVENSVDAKAKSIVIEISNGGKKYIRVTDDGTGINSDDLDIAILRHSTSKIKKIEDLNNLTTLGFRGEALASIASVAQLQIISKTEENISGKQIYIQGGEIISNKEVGCPKGTTVIVKNLFYNTPVRLKFLKGESTEASYISDIIYKLALGNPHISFKYIKDNKLIVKTPGNNDLLSTIYSLFGKEFSDSLFKISYFGEDIKIQGYIAKPSFNRGNRNYQYFYVNGRYVKSQILTKALEEEYKHLIPINRYPVAILFIQIKPNLFDANVHPTKIDIKFRDEVEVKQHVSSIIRTTLKSNNLIPVITMEKRKEKKVGEQQSDIFKFVDATTHKQNNEKKKDLKIGINKVVKNYTESYKLEEQKTLIDNKDITDAYSVKENKITNFSHNNVNYEASILKPKKLPDIKIIGQLFNTFIIGESMEDEALYLIDQHAAHERIMYEKYKKQFESEKIVTQKLLSPEIINLTHTEYEMVRGNLELFTKLGFEIEEFGLNSIVIRSVPMLFGKPNSKKFFMEIVDKLHEEFKTSYELKLEKIIKMACTSAIKAGDLIKNIEIEHLIKDLNNATNPYTCPHGRPVIIKITKYELEKKFKRIQ